MMPVNLVWMVLPILCDGRILNVSFKEKRVLQKMNFGDGKIQISQDEFKNLAGYIKKNFGINLGMEKQALVVGRLQGVLQQKNFENFSAYYDYVVSDKTGEAAATLVNKITTNHTFFMREPEHFTFFRDSVLPGLSSTVKDRDLRVWSAGCSSGEEPYTLAMIMSDFFGTDKGKWNTNILATDISTKVLGEAINGIYNTESLATLPELWKKQYFRKLDTERSIISDKIKNEVIFRKFNFMEKVFPFRKKFHVIFCRNVMIYFDNKTKAELVNKFYEYTEPGGYLFIGHSESLNREETDYKYVLPAVYRR